jgi:hypothetical protein
MAADIEGREDRIFRFTDGTLGVIARHTKSPRVDLAVLRGEADELAPPATVSAHILPPVPPDDPAGSPGWTAAHIASNRPWFDPINERRFRLAVKGVTDPSGEEMFPDAPDDAEAWDELAHPAISAADKVHVIADLRRRAAGKAAVPQANDRGA